MLVERPQKSEEAVNKATARRKTFLRPNWSLIFPASGIAMSWPRK